MANDTNLERARAAIESGLIEEASAIARERDTRNTVDVDVHLGWASILEDLGLTGQATLELNLAIRDAPHRPETYLKLSELYLDMGQASRAGKTLTRLIERNPEIPEYYERAASAFKEAAQFDTAMQIYQDALKATDDNRFKGYIRDMSFIETEEAQDSHVLSETASLVPQKHHLITFCSLFSGREGVYARQWLSPTGESGYTPVNEPLNLKVAENHILGNFTVGAYPVRLDNTVNFIAFDFDVAKFALNKAISSERLWSGLMRRVLNQARKLVDICASGDMSSYLEDSGFKGYHVWIFLESPVPAGVAKKCADLLVAQLAPMPQDITVEVFPKQTTVRSGGLGNLIKLPLGIHKRTGKRSVFISPDAEPYSDQLGFLENVKKTSKRSIYSAIQRIAASPRVVARTVSSPPDQDDAPFDLEEDAPTRPERHLSRATPEAYNMDRDPEFQQLMLKCPVLKHIVDTANQTANLSTEETLVLIHSVGHIKHGPEAVNTIFQRCVNADPSLFMKSQLKGNPVSCPKIRLRVPHISSMVSCNCAFDMSVNLYPTPLIHVRTLSGKESISPLGITVDSLQFQNLVQDYIKLRKQLRETQMLLNKYENNLEGFFNDAGVQSVQTPIGELKMKRIEGQKTIFILEI